MGYFIRAYAYVLAALAPDWHPLLRAFVLTLVVVPTAVYYAVPRLLLVHGRISGAVRARRLRRAESLRPRH